LRAQCCVGGLLDVIYDPKRVLVGKLHEPDRRTPGDVAVLSDAALDSAMLERILEVREKPFAQSDLSAVIHKVAGQGIHKAAVVAIVRGQGILDHGLAPVEGQECGVSLAVFTTSESLNRAILFWARDPERRFASQRPLQSR
jgi:SacI restriction endonuclease